MPRIPVPFTTEFQDHVTPVWCVMAAERDTVKVVYLEVHALPCQALPKQHAGLEATGSWGRQAAHSVTASPFLGPK